VLPPAPLGSLSVAVEPASPADRRQQPEPAVPAAERPHAAARGTRGAPAIAETLAR